MKKITLILVSYLLLVLSSFTFANNKSHVFSDYYSTNYKSFTFIEKGITFSIFQNGEFDFYLNRRENINSNSSYGKVNISYNSGYNYDPFIQYDDFGAIVQVENVPIYYDYYGRVTQVGNVNINYYQNRLARIGGLRVYYNTYGYYSHYFGYINNYNRSYIFNPLHRYFVRPVFSRCIVSYSPYRRNYYPQRYNYYYNHKNYNNNYYNKKRNFKSVQSKVGHGDYRSKNKRIHKKNTDDNRVVRNTSSEKRNYKTQIRTQSTNRRAVPKKSTARDFEKRQSEVIQRKAVGRNYKQSTSQRPQKQQESNIKYRKSVKKNVTKNNSDYKRSIQKNSLKSNNKRVSSSNSKRKRIS